MSQADLGGLRTSWSASAALWIPVLPRAGVDARQRGVFHPSWPSRDSARKDGAVQRLPDGLPVLVAPLAAEDRRAPSRAVSLSLKSTGHWTFAGWQPILEKIGVSRGHFKIFKFKNSEQKRLHCSCCKKNHKATLPGPHCDLAPCQHCPDVWAGF